MKDIIWFTVVMGLGIVLGVIVEHHFRQIDADEMIIRIAVLEETNKQLTMEVNYMKMMLHYESLDSVMLPDSSNRKD